MPLGQTDVFRLYKYLLKWNFSSALHFHWTWALLLRTPVVLTGDEVATLRALAHQLRPHANEFSRAFVFVVANVFGQKDL